MSTTDKRPLKVFLCHASADKPKVRELYRTLKRRGVLPWLDAENLIPGQNWEVEIPKALLSSDAIIICLSPNSVDKEGYVQKEIKFALDKALEMPEGRIFLIPAKLEECNLPFSLRQYQAVNLYEKVGYARLMKALKLRASQLERHTVELPKEGEIAPEIKKVVEENKSIEPKQEKPEIKTSEPSDEPLSRRVDVGGNVITVGKQEMPVKPEEKRIEIPKAKSERPETKRIKPSRKSNTAIIVALIGFVGTIIAALLGSPIIERWFSPAPAATDIASTTATSILNSQSVLPTNTAESRTPSSPTMTPTMESGDQLNFNLAYIVEQDGKSSLYYLNSSKERKELVSSDDLNGINYPAFSSDGNLVAFASKEGIYIVNIISGELKKVSSEGVNPVWHPSGDAISYEVDKVVGRTDYDCTNSGVCATEFVTPSGAVISGKRALIYSFQEGFGREYRFLKGLFSPDWSPNGEKFSYFSRQGNIDYICVDPYPLNDLSSEQSCVRLEGVVGSYDWAPNNNQIVYFAEFYGNGYLFLLDLNDSTKKNINFNYHGDMSPVWNHAGDRIAYVQNTDGNQEIYVMTLDGEVMENITDHSSKDFSPIWSPDDRNIIFVSDRTGNLDLFMIDVSNRTLVNLTNMPSNDFSASLVGINP